MGLKQPNNLLLLALNLHTIDAGSPYIYCILPRPYSNKMSLARYHSLRRYPKFLSVPVSTIDYDNLFRNSCMSDKRESSSLTCKTYSKVEIIQTFLVLLLSSTVNEC